VSLTVRFRIMAFANEVKLFGKWSYEGVIVEDLAIADYLAVTQPKDQVYLPHTAGRYQVKKFRKALCPIVERLCNSLMRKGRNNGTYRRQESCSKRG
jgi:small subunit ribosomal protein S5e